MLNRKTARNRPFDSRRAARSSARPGAMLKPISFRLMSGRSFQTKAQLQFPSLLTFPSLQCHSRELSWRSESLMPCTPGTDPMDTPAKDLGQAWHDASDIDFGTFAEPWQA